MTGLCDQFAARLRDQTRCPALLQVETGMNAVAALEMLALGADVTALVSPISDRASPIKEAGFQVSQQRWWLIGVTLAMVFPGGFEEFEPARTQIEGAIRGWTPEGASEPVQYSDGVTLQYSAAADGGRWLHQLRFRVPTQETIEAQP